MLYRRSKYADLKQNEKISEKKIIKKEITAGPPGLAVMLSLTMRDVPGSISGWCSLLGM